MSWGAYKPPSAPPPPSWSDDLTSGLKINPSRVSPNTWTDESYKRIPPDLPMIPRGNIDPRMANRNAIQAGGSDLGTGSAEPLHPSRSTVPEYRSYIQDVYAEKSPAPAFSLPDKVYSCVCKISLYVEHLGCGIVELQGSNGEKAYCFFLAKDVVSTTITKLADQLFVGKPMKVNARLVSERNKIPYLASTLLPEGVDEKILDDFHDPTPGDVEKYGQLANFLANKVGQEQVIEILDDTSSPPPTIYSSRVQQKLPTPTPTPTPAINTSYPQIPNTYSLAPPYTIPAPKYSAPPPVSAYTAPTPIIPYPPPGFSQPLFPGANPYPPVGTYTNTYMPPPQLATPANSSIIPIQIQAPKPSSLWSEIISDKPAPVPASKLAREFFVEKKLALSASPEADSGEQIPDQTILAAEFKKQEERKLLLVQEEAKRKLLEEKKRSINDRLKCRWTTSSDDTTPGNKTPVLDEEPISDIEVIEKAIANLDKEIQNKRDGKSSSVELDRFGYVVRTNNTEKQAASGSNPAEYYKSLFGGDADTAGRRRRRSRSKSKSPPKRRRSRSRGRKSRSRSRSKSRELRRKSRSPFRRVNRYSISPIRFRARTKSPRRRGSRSPLRRSRSRSPARRYLRQSRSKSRSKGKLRMDSEQKKKGKVYSGPPVPAFMLHPADRLFSGDAERGSSVRKRMYQRKELGCDDVDNGMAALDVTLDLIKEMKADGNEDLTEVHLISMEVEILDDGTFKQFTQIGVSAEDKETGVFNRSLFRSILPTYMDQYDKNLILKNQNNLHSSLKFKYDEDKKIYSFQHVKKGDDKPVSEEKALQDLIAFIKSIKVEAEVVVVTLSKGTILPLLLARLRHFKLDEEFSTIVKGFCDFTSCTTNLKLNGIWKETKFGDLIDVYKHIMGKPWPKEPRHCDGISILSGSVLKKMIKDYTEYLNDLNFKFSMYKFLKVCGLRTVSEMFSSFKEEIQETNCTMDMDRNDVMELELRPSDRPGEITIVTLKRFECIEVLDMDEVEEEGINEDDYFVNEENVAYVTSKTIIKPGFVIAVTMKLRGSTDFAIVNDHTKTEKGNWSLVSKCSTFGENQECEDGECEENMKRIKVASKCEISRQIVQITRSLKPVKDNMSKCEEVHTIQVKVLNPLDVELVLDVGDEVAMVKLEKVVDPNDPDTKTYSQIKMEAEMHALALEQDNLGRAIDTEKERSKKKKKNRSRKRKKQKSGDTTARSTSFDLDALDFEPIDSGEDIESSEDEKDYEDPVNKELEDFTLDSVAAETIERSRNNSGRNGLQKERHREKTGRNSKERGSQSKNIKEKDRIERKDKKLERSRSKDKESDRRSGKKSNDVCSSSSKSEQKKMDPEFYDRRFFVQTLSEFTEIRAGRTQTVSMVVKADYGYTDKDLVGRKCKISINTDFTDLEKNQRHSDQHYKFDNYNLFEKETTLELKRTPKSSWFSPMVDVEIQNFTTTRNEYPKGVRLGICRFIEESETLVKENDTEFYSHWFKCFPPSFCRVNGMTTDTVTMILKEDHGFTIDNMVNQKCRVKKNGSLQSQNQSIMDKEVLNSCCIKEKVATVIRYTDPGTCKMHPAVLLELRNLTPQKKTFQRDLPLALCKFLRPSVKNFVSDVDELETMLPHPVPVRSEPWPPGEEEVALPDPKDPGSSDHIFHYGQGPVRYDDLSQGLGLPEPVPGNKRLLHSIEAVTREPPSEQELKSWSVKKLKSCLGDVGLHQYGLKNDLVKRLYEFYKKNPSKVPAKPLTSQEVAEGLLNEVLNQVFGIESENQHNQLNTNGDSPMTMFDLPVPVSSRIKTEEGSRIPVISKSISAMGITKMCLTVDGLSNGKVCMASDGVYTKNGQPIPVLGGIYTSHHGLRSPAFSSGTASPNGSDGPMTIPVLGSSSSSQYKNEIEKQKIIDVDKEKIMKKIGEIKSLEKQGIEFFKTGMSIMCTEDFIIGPRERKLLTFKMAELDLFSSELAGRRILIKERDNEKRMLTVFKQVANIIVNERKSEVDVLVQNERGKECVVKVSDRVKLIRVYVEKLEKDCDHQFDIPEDDDIIDEVDDFVETEPVDAVTTTDIVLKSKTYHTEICSVKTTQSFLKEPFVVLERTKASGMKIGLRKMILVPKVLSFLNTEGEEASLLVTMYNASKQTLRITKKTKIASVRIQNPDILLGDEYDIVVDQRRKYGELEVTDRSLVKEDKPVLLTYIENGTRKPSLVKIVSRSGKPFVPLGSELSGVRKDFKVKFL
eukprot:GFUD01032620.1.p1 GENE.GFUD01032620.1~~GFUD01032620.1.p1  ORF type:complete len:2235 (+),score=576.38 GFUD01032620.1:40-6744(+)